MKLALRVLKHAVLFSIFLAMIVVLIVSYFTPIQYEDVLAWGERIARPVHRFFETRAERFARVLTE